MIVHKAKGACIRSLVVALFADRQLSAINWGFSAFHHHFLFQHQGPDNIELRDSRARIRALTLTIRNFSPKAWFSTTVHETPDPNFAIDRTVTSSLRLRTVLFSTPVCGKEFGIRTQLMKPDEEVVRAGAVAGWWRLKGRGWGRTHKWGFMTD
ncbi:hypothetical protein B0J14DRAFT_558093 [Halenospora varia]|nr:hypothetical protein B0J14DRAFT_558093 [Halenospora varia]